MRASTGRGPVVRIRRALDARRRLRLYRPLPSGTPARSLFLAKAKSIMSRRCEITGVGPMVGHNVSHSNIKTKRRFLPSLAETKLQSEILGQSFRLKITNAALRTLDFKGGLDPVLMNSRDEVLSPRALKI